MNAVRYLILQSHETKGPYTREQLRSMWHSGLVTGETLFCEDGSQEWSTLETIAAQLESTSARPTGNDASENGRNVPPLIPEYIAPPVPLSATLPARSNQPSAMRIIRGAVLACGLIFVGLLLLGGIIAFLGHSGSSSHSSSGSAPNINTRVSLTFDNIRISNLDSFDWPQTTIYLDGIMGGYLYRTAFVEAGKSITIPLREFATRGGERFDPNRRKPKEIVVYAEGYNGRQFRN